MYFSSLLSKRILELKDGYSFEKVEYPGASNILFNLYKEEKLLAGLRLYQLLGIVKFLEGEKDFTLKEVLE